MSQSFDNRVFGCVIVKAINASYNADFTGQPRTLPDGRVYATDKALKYSIRNFILKFYEGKEKVFYFKRLNDDFNPYDLLGAYRTAFGSTVSVDTRSKILQNLFNCIDVRLFGATFAPKGDSEKGKNVSIHGCVQITHAIDRYEQGRIYSEQITSPFSDPKSKTDKDTKEVTKTDPSQTTIGNQSMLSEGHYVHHFSVNPKNIEDLVKKSKATPLSIGDIDILKQTMKTGVTYYDSSKKAGVDNELLLWVQLKAESKIVLPSFVEMVDVKDDAKRTIDLAKIKTLLAQATIATDIESIELYYDSATTVVNAPEKAVVKSLN